MPYVKCRERAGREPSPTAAVIDSQSVKGEKGGSVWDTLGGGGGGGRGGGGEGVFFLVGGEGESESLRCECQRYEWADIDKLRCGATV